MDQDVTKLREELDNAKKEWRKAKYLNNGDKKKQSCLLRVQAAERALELYSANNAAVGMHAREPSLREISSTNQLATSAPSLDTAAAINVKKELIEGLNFDGPRDSIEGSNPENAMDVDVIFAMQEIKANEKDSISGQNSDVDTPPQPEPGVSAEILNMNPMPVLAEGHSSSIQQQSSVSSVNITQDIPLVPVNSVHEIIGTIRSQPMDIDTAGAAVPSAQAQSAYSINELSNKELAQGHSTAPSSDTSVRDSQSAAANMSMELGEYHPLGVTVVAQSQSMGSDIAPLMRSESSSSHYDAPSDTASKNMDTTMDSPLEGSAKTVDFDFTNGKVLLSVTEPPTYRVISSAFIPQPVAKTVSIAQNGFTPEGQHDQNFVFPAAPITINSNVPVISNDLLGMDLGEFHPSDDLFSQGQLWTIPEADEDIKNDDIEAIAPYSVTPESQTQTSHRSDTEAISALSTELNNTITQMPNVLVHGQYTFKIDDINWGTPFPSYTRMASDSDIEHRLHLELYKAKAAWMFVCAYKNWMQDQMQILKDQATRGISDFTVFMSTWNMCEMDMKVLSTRADDAKKQMDVAQKAMDSCFKGKSRAVLEYSIEELQARILSNDDISRDDLHLLRTKLMTQKDALREIVAEEEVKGIEDDRFDSGRPARKGTKNHGDSDASIPYMKYSEEKQINIEKKARTTFHNFARFAASANPTSSGLKSLGEAFKVLYRIIIRTIRGFLPEAATTCRRSALLCLTTGTPNSFCLGHHCRHAECRHNSVTHFRGVAYPKNATARGCGLSNPKFPEPNHLHCGCLIDDALLEFYFYKTVTARSTHPLLSGIIHYMDDAFTPFIIRSFWMSQFRATTGLTMDDIYNLNTDEAMHQVAFTARMIQKHVFNMRNNRNVGVSLTFDSPEDEAAFYGTTIRVETEHLDNSVESESSDDSESDVDK